MRRARKQNLNPEKRAAISSRDLHESFVESLDDWHDDFDDGAKMRFGRGLKAADEATSDSGKIDGSTIGNEVRDINSGFNFPRNSSHRDMSIFQDRYNNTPANLIDIYNRNRYYNRGAGQVYEPDSMSISDRSEDLEVAEQRYTTPRQTPRTKRAAVAYRALYDDFRNPGNSDGENLDNRFSLPRDSLEDRSDLYREYAPNWDDSRDLDRYLKTPRSVRKREKSKEENKRRKQFSQEKHARREGGSRSSASRNRRHHHAHHRSDASRNVNRNDLKTRKKQNKAEASSVTGRTGGVQKSKSAERRPLLRAAEVNETPPIERVLYENAEDQSVSVREIDDRVPDRARDQIEKRKRIRADFSSDSEAGGGRRTEKGNYTAPRSRQRRRRVADGHGGSRRAGWKNRRAHIRAGESRIASRAISKPFSALSHFPGKQQRAVSNLLFYS